MTSQTARGKREHWVKYVIFQGEKKKPARDVFQRTEHAPLGSKNLQEQEEATLESQLQLKKKRAGDKCFFLLPFRENLKKKIPT